MLNSLRNTKRRTMKRIRTIEAAYNEIKAADPGTSLTKCALRRAVSSGEIPSRRVGSRGGYKYMVDLDKVIEYFAGEGGM